MTIPRIRTRNRAPEGQVEPSSISNRMVVVERKAEDLHPASQRARKAGKGQLERIRTNIDRFGCVLPIPVTAAGEIIDGHNVWKACKSLGRPVPTVVVEGLSDSEIRTLRLSLNRLGELSSWDDDILREELEAILAEDPDLSLFTGFTAAEIDARLIGPLEDDEDDLKGSEHPKLGRVGDIWCFAGGHQLLQGDARLAANYFALLGDNRARALISDIPYGCKIKGHASQSHEDFLDGSNLAADELQELVEAYLRNARGVMAPGALTYTFMDGRGLLSLMAAARKMEQTQVGLCIWDKVNPGMGSLYRQQAEFIQVCKFDTAKHLNNVALGKNRRNRSNIWSYPGMAAFSASRTRTLALHPTVKPIGLIADIILDCTSRSDIVLDPFSGSGTIILAAQRTKRCAYAIELDPIYIDVAVKRAEQSTGRPAVHRETGKTYAETMGERFQKAA